MDSKLKAQPAESMNINDDEIDLFELWNGLVAEKLTIMASFIITVLLATVYAFSVTPVSQSETYLLPPPAEKVLPMNELAIVLGAGSATHTPSSVFTQFKINLDSGQTLKAIFNKYHLINTYNPDIDQLSGADKIKSEKVAFC